MRRDSPSSQFDDIPALLFPPTQSFFRIHTPIPPPRLFVTPSLSSLGTGVADDPVDPFTILLVLLFLVRDLVFSWRRGGRGM